MDTTTNGEKMKRKILIIVSLLCLMALTLPAFVWAEANPELLEVAKDKLKEKTKQSGTLDIFDEKKEQVRNLRKIKLSDDVIEKDGKYLITGDYRDINTGDVVTIEIEMTSKVEDFVIGEIRIKEVKAMDEGAKKGKEYTDSEIQKFMRDYIVKQGEFNDGKIMLYDKDNEKMRNLKLKELKEEVRRMGIFYSSSAKFADVDTDDILDIDISVENKKGTLKIQALRIRNIRKGLVGKDISQE